MSIGKQFTAPLRIAPNFPKKSSVVEDERVTLVCSLSSGLGTLKWTKHEQDFGARDYYSNSNDDHQHRHQQQMTPESPFTVLDTAGFTSLLSIESVKPSHAGTYTCTAYDPFPPSPAPMSLPSWVP